jgi:murein DD-endopeptidase MepM/ murein hydrolase activator NlpD
VRYPVNNYKTEWDNHAGYDYGDPVSYGFHDGKDINDNGAGNSDLGKPLFAIADGKVVGIHKHPQVAGFGNHFFIMIQGTWGTRYVHYAHCLEILVQEGQDVKEGDKVATVGNSGTVYAHCHFAIKKVANGMDTIAGTREQLDSAWEDPIAFVERYIGDTPPSDTITIDKATFEKLVGKSTHYDAFVEQGYNNVQDVENKVNQLTKELNECKTNLSPQKLEAIRLITYDKWNIIPTSKYWYGTQLHRIKKIFEKGL